MVMILKALQNKDVVCAFNKAFHRINQAGTDQVSQSAPLTNLVSLLFPPHPPYIPRTLLHVELQIRNTDPLSCFDVVHDMAHQDMV